MNTEYTNTRIHEYTNTEYTNTRIHEYTNTRIHKYTNTRIHEYTNTRIHKYTNTQIHEYTNTRIHKAEERKTQTNQKEQKFRQHKHETALKLSSTKPPNRVSYIINTSF